LQSAALPPPAANHDNSPAASAESARGICERSALRITPTSADQPPLSRSIHVGPHDYHDHGTRLCLLRLLSPHAGQFRFRDQRTYGGRSAAFLGHSLDASSFCVSNQAFKRNLPSPLGPTKNSGTLRYPASCLIKMIWMGWAIFPPPQTLVELRHDRKRSFRLRVSAHEADGTEEPRHVLFS
jgi:hypothetical protein